MLFAGCEQVVDDGFNIVTAAIRVYESMAAGFHTFKVPAGRFLFMQFVGGFYIGIWETGSSFALTEKSGFSLVILLNLMGAVVERGIAENV